VNEVNHSVNDNEFMVIQTGNPRPLSQQYSDISAFVRDQLDYFAQARQSKEETWLECWAAYMPTPEAEEHMRKRVLKSVGDTHMNWRHKINVGKAFENVETINGYLQSAFFPNRDWMDVQPRMPGYVDTAELVKKYMLNKLDSLKFKTYWDMFTRQLLITGWSVMALPWRHETRKWKKRIKKTLPKVGAITEEEAYQFEVIEEEKVVHSAPDFEVLDVFDCYLDPDALDANSSAFIRKIARTKAEVLTDLRTGYYQKGNINELEVIKHGALDANHSNDASRHKNTLKSFQGVQVAPYRMNDRIELVEYWGDVVIDGYTYKDVVVTILGDRVLRFVTNPYWCGKPFVVGTYIPIVRSPYALGAIEPSLGMLHELNLITNQRLDNLEISADSMYTLRADGTLQPEDVWTEPGKVFPVSEHDDLRPVDHSQPFTITYEEATVLEQRIDKNTGTGAFIGAGPGRSGDRVTKAEVQAVRDAGGNRLSSLHKHIEQTSLLLVLEKVLRLAQEYTTEDEVIRTVGKEPGTFEYYEVGPEELNMDFFMSPVGADHVADRDDALNKRMSFLELIAKFPEQFSPHIDFYQLLLQIVRYYGFDDYESFVQKDINKPQPDPAAMPPEGLPPEGMPNSSGAALLPEPDPLEQAALEMGGEAGAAELQAQMAADGGMDMMKRLFGDMDPRMAAAAPPSPEDVLAEQ